MLTINKRHGLIGLSQLVVLLGLATPAAAQDQAAPTATFRSLPVQVPTYADNPYGYSSVYPNYLSGAADVINSQGQMMVDQQQAFLMKEQVRSAKIDNRRRALDESLYERAVTPTTEDERERFRIEQVRRSRNDPPLTEIWSAKALNDLLRAIQKQQAQRVEGPMIPVTGEVLNRVNTTGGKSDNSLASIRNGGKVHWPLALAGTEFDSTRKDLDTLSAQAYREAQSGAVQPTTILGMTRAAESIRVDLKKNIENISANDYIAAKRFINDMNGTIQALQDPNVASYAAAKWPESGMTVADLTQQMTRQGLRFAPAVPGDESAYTALHRAMVAYYSPDPSRKWDPLAK
jgi:hypothetical protein